MKKFFLDFPDGSIFQQKIFKKLTTLWSPCMDGIYLIVSKGF